MNELVVNIDSFKFSKSSKPFFENISIDLKDKELNFLIGMSGIGKTTLLKIILGIYKDFTDSNVYFRTDNISYSCSQAQKLGLIGLISQTPSLISWETINTNIKIPSKINNKLNSPTSKEINMALISVGLDESILRLFPHQLSFGMQSRISIVRTLLYKPKFLFLDELFTGIDTINSNLIAEKLKSYVETNNAVCLSITHDIDRAVNIASNIFLLNKSQSLIKIELPFCSKKIIDIINNN